MPVRARTEFDELIEAAEDDVAALSGHLAALKLMRPERPARRQRPARLCAEKLARHLYRERRARAKHFNAALFGEPGWDLLLDLYVARCEGETRSTKSACIGAAAAQTTALRWLTKLEEAGMLVRWHPDHDERLTLVALTDDAFTRMTAFLERAAAG